MPAAWTAPISCRTAACPHSTASRWKVNMLAPAAAKSATHRAGWATIRWQSRKAGVWRRRLWTMGGPRVRLGTKWPSWTREQGGGGHRQIQGTGWGKEGPVFPAALPSTCSSSAGGTTSCQWAPTAVAGSRPAARTITSTCSQSAPSSTIRLDSSASLPKSQESKEGAIIVGGRSRPCGRGARDAMAVKQGRSAGFDQRQIERDIQGIAGSAPSAPPPRAAAALQPWRRRCCLN